MSDNSRRPPPPTVKVMSSALAEFFVAMFFIFGISFLSVYIILFHLV